MKIRSVKANKRMKSSEVKTYSKVYSFPFAKADPPPVAGDSIVEVSVDKEIDRQGFVYTLESGKEGTVQIEQVLEYNQDPRFLRDLLLYRLTIAAQEKLEESGLSKREIVRRLGTSATQLYRLMDQTNYRKSVDQMLSLLHVLDCDVELVVKAKSA